MLEIKNVTKIYKAKGGVPTKALDDVSISFGETGLVFLLGKSGSGKSTLLNISGGLDEPTSGEVIVKGKSSKDFSGSDFDSYRNTFVGFIFQEYNILDEFNVEDNIALALELQGKPKDREKINALLAEVDLQNYAKRKPNTLSGGQKQRIAIARALIKEPQIIMADEPTGALDSATGKQVFDTLKKLAETRLVIVVSHDREFAEIYGDRIVELKDGKIISDVTKRNIEAKSVDDNLSLVGEDTLTIKKGSKLTSKNIAKINEFLGNAEGDVIITRGEREVTAFRKATRMSEDGATESFSDTATDDVELKTYGKDDSRFIRSKLPAGKAIKIGASGLKLKPLRLLFTIFLSFIAFTMFGLFSTLMTYDGDAVGASSFAENGASFLNIGKNYHYRYVYWDGSVEEYEWYSNAVKFTSEEVQYFKEQFGDSVFATIGSRYTEFKIGNADTKQGVSDDYYKNSISKFTQTENGRHTIPLIAGEYPENSDEIAVSSYLVGVLKNSEFYLVNENGENININGAVVDKEVAFEISDAQSLVGKYLTIPISYSNNKTAFKVTGVFDSGNIDSKFDPIRDDSLNTGNMSGYMLMYEYESYLKENLHTLAIVGEDFYDTYGSYFSGSSTQYIEEFEYLKSDELRVYVGDKESGNISYYNNVKVYNPEDAYFKPEFFGQSKTVLADDEIIVHAETVLSLIGKYIWAEEQPYPNWYDENPMPYEWEFDDMDAYNQAYEEWSEQRDIVDKAISDWNEKRYEDSEKYNRYYQILINGGYNYYDYDLDESVYVAATPQLIAEGKAWMASYLAGHMTDGYLTVQISVGDRSGKDYKILGYYLPEGNVYTNRGMYISQGYYDSLDVYSNVYYGKQETNYVEPEGAIYDGIYVPYDRTEAGFYALMEVVGYKHLNKETDVFYSLNSSLYESVEMITEYVEMFSTIFLWVGVGFAVFASLLMFNFISMSISNKRKEIGILRAVGARGTDVFKIFFAESGIIVGICLILAVIGSIAVSMVLNNVLRAEAGLMVTIFVFSWISIVIMLALALLVAFISTFLPVFFAARKKPVESIRAL